MGGSPGRAAITRATSALLVLAVGATMAGCGKKKDQEPAAKDPESTPSASASPSATGLPKIKGAKVVPIPSEGPTAARGFPIPPWVGDIKGPGALDESWQFDIPTDDTDRVITFYKKILPTAGYKIRTDVEETLGNETMIWDIVFDGPCHGTIVADKAEGVVFVEARAVQSVE